MAPIYRCWAEVDLHSLQGNLAWLRQAVGPGVKILTVVKADAYGHGLRQIAAVLMQSGTDMFGVANVAEAQLVRAVGQGWPILVLGPCLPTEVDTAVREHLSVTVSSLAEAGRFSTAATTQRRVARLHVKVDTGMGRLGVPPAKACELVQAIKRLPAVKLEGLLTHYAKAEDDAAFTRRQARRFRTVVARLRTAGITIPLIHANNSAGVLHQPGTLFNLARPGLLVYGVIPPGSRRSASELQARLAPALSWKCRVGLVKSVPRGTPLSYGATIVTRRPTQLAVITAGYGDGYMRAGSNRAHVLIHGRRCRVLGRVTMDQMLVEVSHLTDLEPGDEVVLLGRQGSESISAVDLGRWFGTIPWEVLTNINYRVPRVYRGTHAA